MKIPLLMAIVITPWLAVLCWYDVKLRRLPNVLTVGLALGALVWRLGYGGLPMLIDGAVAGFAAALFLFIPFLLRGAGGGDVKMLMAAGCYCGLARVPMMLFYMSLAGCIMAVVMLIAGRVDSRRIKHWARCVFDWRYDRKAGAAALPPKSDERGRLPFGVAIACGIWITFIVELILRRETAV